MEYKKTVKKEIALAGTGLHTGKQVTIRIKPSYQDVGILFVRTDLEGDNIVPARAPYIVDTRFATTIGRGSAVISTVEHLMAAFAGCGIDTAIVEIDGPEVPVFDGSAAPFVALIKETGTASIKFPKTYLKILEEISVSDGDKKVTLRPCDCFKVDFRIKFDHPVIRAQRFKGKISEKTFKKRIAIARTFGFLRDVELLKKNGLARGGSLDNAVVIGEDGILNQEGLRFSDEFVRHKVLDLVGDLYMLGAPLKAEVRAVKSGHTLHAMLARKVLETPSCWELVEARGRLAEWTMPQLLPQPAGAAAAAI